jgi:hypothetical protein
MALEVHMMLKTPRGFYEEVTFKASNVKAALNKIIPALEAMPAEVDGAKQYEWDLLSIRITK